MAVSERNRVLKEVRAALEREPRVNLHKFPIEMDFRDGVLTLEGEVEHIAAKKLSLSGRLLCRVSPALLIAFMSPQRRAWEMGPFWMRCVMCYSRKPRS